MSYSSCASLVFSVMSIWEVTSIAMNVFSGIENSAYTASYVGSATAFRGVLFGNENKLDDAIRLLCSDSEETKLV